MNWYKKSQLNNFGKPLEFDTKTQVPMYDDMMSEQEMGWHDPKTFQYKIGPKKDYFKEIKGKSWHIEQMSPIEYIDKCAQGFYQNKNLEDARYELLKYRVDNRELVEKYKKMWMEGSNPPMVYIEYRNGSFFGQEGLHRAIVAKELGVKSIPVMIIKSK